MSRGEAVAVTDWASDQKMRSGLDWREALRLAARGKRTVMVLAEMEAEVMRNVLAALRGSVPAANSDRFEAPSLSRSERLSEGSAGLRPLADSQSEGRPSESRSAERKANVPAA